MCISRVIVVIIVVILLIGGSLLVLTNIMVAPQPGPRISNVVVANADMIVITIRGKESGLPPYRLLDRIEVYETKSELSMLDAIHYSYKEYSNFIESNDVSIVFQIADIPVRCYDLEYQCYIDIDSFPIKPNANYYLVGYSLYNTYTSGGIHDNGKDISSITDITRLLNKHDS